MGQGHPEEEDQDSWAAQEMLKANLGDKRLNRRASKVLHQLAQRPEGSVPCAFQSWPEALAAYRFFDNEKVSAEKVLEPHRDATLERVREFPVVLCVQDTTELDFTGKPQIQGLGPLSHKSALGLYIHPTLAITPERLCLGVVDQWSWVRDMEDHGGKDRQHRLRRSLEEKESSRWVEGYRRVCDWQSTLSQTRLVYMADGDSDLFELFEEGETGEADWLIRASQDRALATGGLLKATLRGDLGHSGFRPACQCPTGPAARGPDTQSRALEAEASLSAGQEAAGCRGDGDSGLGGKSAGGGGGD